MKKCIQRGAEDLFPQASVFPASLESCADQNLSYIVRPHGQSPTVHSAAPNLGGF